MPWTEKASHASDAGGGRVSASPGERCFGKAGRLPQDLSSTTDLQGLILLICCSLPGSVAPGGPAGGPNRSGQRARRGNGPGLANLWRSDVPGPPRLSCTHDPAAAGSPRGDRRDRQAPVGTDAAASTCRRADATQARSTGRAAGGRPRRRRSTRARWSAASRRPRPPARARGLDVRDRAPPDRGGLRERGPDARWRQLVRTKPVEAGAGRRPVRIRFPDGETLREVQLRAVEALDRHRGPPPRRRSWRPCAHADVIRLALAHYAGVHLDLFQRLDREPRRRSRRCCWATGSRGSSG